MKLKYFVNRIWHCVFSTNLLKFYLICSRYYQTHYSQTTFIDLIRLRRVILEKLHSRKNFRNYETYRKKTCVLSQ
jgi:hypothetical protein